MSSKKVYPLNKFFIWTFITLLGYLMGNALLVPDYQRTPLPIELASPSSSGKRLKMATIVQSDTLGEREVAQRYKIAAEQLNWEAYEIRYMYALGENWFTAQLIKAYIQILDYIFKPDFYFSLLPTSYEVLPKDKPRYLKIMGVRVEKEQIVDSYQFLGDYDGFVEVDTTQAYLNPEALTKFSHAHVKKNWDIISGYPSTFKTPFTKVSYTNLFYCGDNWDAYRRSDKFKHIFKALEDRGYLYVYGPESHWSFLKKSYKGFIPINGYSLIKKMQKAGIVLVVHSTYHMERKIPSARIFEAAAASSLIISDENEFVKKEFGNCVSYVDYAQSESAIVNRIDNIVAWARENPLSAQKQAKCAHDIFIKKFALEFTLEKIAEKVRG